MLHIPINTIMSAPPQWRDALGLPMCSAGDWKEIDQAGRLLSDKLTTTRPFFQSLLEDNDVLMEMERLVARLSFANFLEDRLMSEATTYKNNGVTSMMIENVAAPYFVRERQPLIVTAIMNQAARRLRDALPDIRCGIQLLAFSDDLALGIAMKNGFHFMRSESALFTGVRPEGKMVNQSNLATLYAMRNRWEATQGRSGPSPEIYVDIQKKHTHFMSALNDINVWLQNITFQKLEGIILTGVSTGEPTDEAELRSANEFIEQENQKNAKRIGPIQRPLLIVGSGVNKDNVISVKKHADAVIVGSSIKKKGYWENPLDEVRLKGVLRHW